MKSPLYASTPVWFPHDLISLLYPGRSKLYTFPTTFYGSLVYMLDDDHNNSNNNGGTSSNNGSIRIHINGNGDKPVMGAVRVIMMGNYHHQPETFEITR